MTRIFTDGAEFGDALFWDIVDSLTVITVNPVPRSGDYCYKPSGGSIKYVEELNEAYLRFAVYGSSWGTTANLFLPQFRNSTTTHVSLSMVQTDGKIHLNAGGSTDVASSTNVISQSEWHLIEVYVKISNSPDGRCIVKLDGITEIDYTGDTQNGATTTFDNLHFYRNVTITWIAIDDLALNSTVDTDGKGDISWCGDGHVEVLMPNNNGDVNDWDGSDGDSVNNYLLVDERPHDTDTTYVKTGVTEQDMYNVEDYDPTGGKIVRRIWAECRAKDNTASGGTIKLGYKHGGTVYLSSAQVLPSTYARVVGDEALSDPSDSTVWSEADLDSIQFVVECSSSSSSTTSSSSSSTTTSSSSSTEIP